MQITNKLASIAECETSNNPKAVSEITPGENIGFEFRQLPNNDYSLKTRFQFFAVNAEKDFAVIIDGDSIVDFTMDSEEIFKEHFLSLYQASVHVFQDELNRFKVKNGIDFQNMIVDQTDSATDKIIELLNASWENIVPAT